MPLHYLFVDFNSYFASVEQQVRPELRGKPIAVAPMDVDSTVCIAASYEAKAFGVKTGTMLRDARRLCPHLTVVEARPSLYVEYHHKLIAAVESCIPVDKVLSVDEMVCTLTGSQRQRERAIELAREIKQTIRSTVGTELRCSIGIAPNAFLSKTASDMQKPDGLVVIDLPDLPECLFTLELRDLTGIGPRMEKRLRENGLHTVRDLWNADRARLRKVWGGIEGDRMYENLRGEVVHSPPTKRSSVGHSHVLEPEFRTEEKAVAVLHRLLQKAAVRLRTYGYLASAMTVKMKYLGDFRWVDEIHFAETQDSLLLIDALATMWKRKPASDKKPFKVDVTLWKLSEASAGAPMLFPLNRSSAALNAAIDKLNAKYSKQTIYFGGAHSALDSAPMRIAFNYIPDPDVEGDE